MRDAFDFMFRNEGFRFDVHVLLMECGFFFFFGGEPFEINAMTFSYL